MGEYQMLESCLEKIRTGIINWVYPNEASVCLNIAMPILRSLNWPEDPSAIQPEYPIESYRADLALFANSGLFADPPHIIVELKSVGSVLDGVSEFDIQLFNYCVRAGTQVAVLTDGNIWKFFLTHEHGSIEQRLVQRISIRDDKISDVAEALMGYLEHQAVMSGDALANLQSRHKVRREREQRVRNIPDLWSEIVRSRSADIAKIFWEVASDPQFAISGSRFRAAPPERDEVVSFIQTLEPRHVESRPRLEISDRSKPARSSREIGKAHQPTDADDEAPSRSGGGTRLKVRWVFGGKAHAAKTFAEAYVKIVKYLFKHHGKEEFVGKYNSMVRMNSQNSISKNRTLTDSMRPIGNGWYVNAHNSSKQKMANLRRMCHAAEFQIAKLKLSVDG